MLIRRSRMFVLGAILALASNACVSDEEVPVEDIVTAESLAEGLTDVAEPADLGGSNINLADSTVYFGYDDATVDGDEASKLDAIASALQNDPNMSITIEGHCDERGSVEYNLALGERRAQAIKSYLITLGVSANQLSTVSMGEESPAVLGGSEGDYAKNRRVQFTQ